MQISIKHAADITDSLDAAIRRNLCICFPADREVFSKTRAWHGCLADWTVLIEEGHDVITHLGVIDRTIRVGDVLLHVGGVQNVFTLPAYRGQGLSDSILTSAMNHARSLGYDFGLLFCAAAFEKVYRRAGWMTLAQPNITYLDDAGGEAVWDNRDPAMVYPLTQTSWPQGPIHLQGPAW